MTLPDEGCDLISVFMSKNLLTLTPLELIFPKKLLVSPSDVLTGFHELPNASVSSGRNIEFHLGLPSNDL